jgi:hypothetical protein
MLFSSPLAKLLAGGVASVVAQQGYGNANHTSPGGNESLANAPYSTLLHYFLCTQLESVWLNRVLSRWFLRRQDTCVH